MRNILSILVISLNISFVSTVTLAQETTSINQLNWLVGCWNSNNSKYDAREHWMPPDGKMMVGISHTVSDGKTVTYEYLRIEEMD